jgi:hypothetical protein
VPAEVVRLERAPMEQEVRWPRIAVLALAEWVKQRAAVYSERIVERVRTEPEEPQWAATPPMAQRRRESVAAALAAAKTAPDVIKFLLTFCNYRLAELLFASDPFSAG